MERYTRKHNRTRPRSFLSLYLRLGGWISLILGAILVFLTLISATQLWIADRLDRDGKFAQAVILETRSEVTVDEDGDESTDYYASFRFKDSRIGGLDYEKRVSRGYFEEVQTGDEVTIRYLRSDPQTFEYEIGQYRRDGHIVRYIGLFFGIAGLLTLWRVGRRATNKLLARKQGEKRFARVTGILEAGRSVNGRRKARLTWQEEDGQTGESLLRDARELSGRYKAGDQIVVFRLGETSVWEGDVGPPKREMEG